MKLLGNPWIVGGLCVIAVGLVGYQVLAPRSPGGKATAPNRPALVTAASPARSAPGVLAARASDPGRAAARTAPGTNATPPATLIDRTYVQSHLAQWVASPSRDPFQLLSPSGKPAPVAKPAPVPVSPVSRWKLKAVWQQSGSRLAAINTGVYAEGDVIKGYEGYRIEQIESDQVWFQGPTGRESLSFTNAPPGTNAPANKPRK
jgi:hypothetical protein